jgi:hydroxymethylglutaryl-CoA reductase (NADPH)
MDEQARPERRAQGPADAPRPARWPSATEASAAATAARRAALAQAGCTTAALSGAQPPLADEALAGSIEGFVGYASVPVGVFGPLSIAGDFARGEFFVPIATTEGALVASYQHVANLLSRAGGVATRLSGRGVQRAPCFAFADLGSAARFAEWLPGRRAALEALVAEGSRHCRLQGLRPALLGNTVFVLLEFATGDAAGQNMVTLAAQAIATRVLDETPVPIEHWQLESNWSGDKKASYLALLGGRGRRVSAEAQVPARLCTRYFRASASDMVRAWNFATVGAALSGTVGVQANVANALAGLFIACGQDVACVAEASAGVTRAECTPAGDLRISVTLPNLIVGSVGGGTRLPTARECLAMLRCAGDGGGDKLAEIACAVALAGEIALIGAMAGGAYAAGHANHGRARGG